MRVTILYLAAGNSRRFGENKLLYPLDGKAVYRHLLDRLAQIAGRHENWELLVVTQYERILEELAPLVKAGRLQTVFSPDSEKGISYTIRAGIEAAEKQNADACACFAADQPYLKEETAERFLESMEMQKAPLGCRGGKKVLKRHWESVIPFRVEAAWELKDLDRKEDL